MNHCHPNVMLLQFRHFALNGKMVNELPSTVCLGIDGGSGCGFHKVEGELQERNS